MAQLPALAELEPLQRLVGRPSTGPELDIHVDQQKAENIHSPSGWGQTEFFFLCALCFNTKQGIKLGGIISCECSRAGVAKAAAVTLCRSR